MRILTVSDKVEPVLYSPHIRERVGKIDLILGCGDVPHYYLEYIVDLLDAPLFFVHGNHDKAPPVATDNNLFVDPACPGWAVDLHGRALQYRGLLLAGLEGCRMYNPGAPYQYSESDVKWQAFVLGFKLWLNRFKSGRHLDILITHAPPRGIHDAEDVAHQGFVAYLKLLRRFQPLAMVHGHQHVYDHNATVETDFESTRIINTYGYRVLELARRADGRGWRIVSSGR